MSAERARESGRLPYPASPLRLAPATAGEYAITHKIYPPDQPIAVVSLRSAFLTGERPLSVQFDAPYRVHRLERNGDVLMTDHPQELYQMAPFVERAAGRVLIGGLGLSVIARMIAAKKEVKRIEVVEISEDVIRLCGKRLGPKVRVIKADLYAWLREQTEWPYDRAFFDIWYPTSETAWINWVAPLRRIVRRKFGEAASRRLDCWAEPEMLGQVARALANDAARGIPPEQCWSDAYKAFRATTLHLWPVLPAEPAGTETMARLANSFVIAETPQFKAALDCFTREIGSPVWEEGFGKHWPLRDPKEDD